MNSAAVYVCPDPVPEPGDWNDLTAAAALVPGGWLAVVCDPPAAP